MISAEDWITHSIKLLGTPNDPRTSAIDLRRAVSASYYALFHAICRDAAELLAPNVPSRIQNRIQRWFDHGQMRVLCARISKPTLDQPLADLIGDPTIDLQLVGSSFVHLQELRHSADYDADCTLSWDQAKLAIELAIRALGAWRRIHGTSEANVFILSLLVWKNWERDR